MNSGHLDNQPACTQANLAWKAVRMCFYVGLESYGSVDLLEQASIGLTLGMCIQVLWWYGTGYAIVLWSIAGTTGEWVYPMMNWNIPFSLIAYLVMPILPFIAFLIWCALLGCPLA